MYYFYQCHNVTLFPLLLAMGQCTPTEYANGVMAAHVLLTTCAGEVTSAAHAQQARAFREDAQIAVDFLENARSPWMKEILNGEDSEREFKATMRYDLKTGTYNKALEHSVLKNVAAFLNTDGGTVFVGVGDDQDIVGIELDGFSNDDKWSLHLTNRIGQQIGKRFLTLCRIEFDSLHSKTVARISIRPSDEPVFLDERALLPTGKKDAVFCGSP